MAALLECRDLAWSNCGWPTGQGARKLFSGVIRGSGPVISKATWAFDEVESELADHGYMRPVVMTLRWLARRKVQAFVDCEQIQNLAEDCTLAVDRWNRAWAADAAPPPASSLGGLVQHGHGRTMPSQDAPLGQGGGPRSARVPAWWERSPLGAWACQPRPTLAPR